MMADSLDSALDSEEMEDETEAEVEKVCACTSSILLLLFLPSQCKVNFTRSRVGAEETSNVMFPELMDQPVASAAVSELVLRGFVLLQAKSRIPGWLANFGSST